MSTVTVAVITYNSSATVMETLDSVFDQTYSPIELIVSDDCSKDDTIAIAEKWIEEHKERFIRVKVLKSENNTGVTGNCNRCFNTASGKYIQLVAGDDLLMPTAIADKITFAEQHNLDYVVAKVEPFGENAEKVAGIKKWCEEGYAIVAQGYDAQVENILKNNFLAGPAGSFFRLSFIKEIGGFDERYPLLEDYPFIYHYVLSGNEILLLNKALTQYRIGSGSLSVKGHSPMWTSHWKFFFHERLGELLRRGKFGTAAYQICFCIRKRFL